MNCKTLVASTLLTATSLISAMPAEASSCNPTFAADLIGNIMRGGGSRQIAAKAALNEGYYDGSSSCYYAIRGYIRKYPYYFGNINF